MRVRESPPLTRTHDSLPHSFPHSSSSSSTPLVSQLSKACVVTRCPPTQSPDLMASAALADIVHQPLSSQAEAGLPDNEGRSPLFPAALVRLLTVCSLQFSCRDHWIYPSSDD